MKGQIKMFETVGVLIVFFFLLSAAAIFYFQAQQSNIQQETIYATEKYSLQLATRALYLPELDCSLLSTTRDNCIDDIKLQKMSALLQTNAQDDYYDTFKDSTITVTQIYPNTKIVQLYNSTPQQYNDKLVTHSPILLYNPLSRTYGFAVIEVAVYA